MLSLHETLPPRRITFDILEEIYHLIWHCQHLRSACTFNVEGFTPHSQTVLGSRVMESEASATSSTILRARYCAPLQR